GINRQRNSIIKHANSATYNKKTFGERSPGGPDSRRETESLCELLIFETSASIQGEARQQCPMVLCEQGCLDVGMIDRRSACKFDSFEHALVLIPDLDRLEGKACPVGGSRQSRSEF